MRTHAVVDSKIDHYGRGSRDAQRYFVKLLVKPLGYCAKRAALALAWLGYRTPYTNKAVCALLES